MYSLGISARPRSPITSTTRVLAQRLRRERRRLDGHVSIGQLRHVEAVRTRGPDPAPCGVVAEDHGTPHVRQAGIAFDNLS